MPTKTIKVDYLARVEGEGALSLRIKDGVVEDAKLSIFEPPRFFEAMLRGRDAHEAPDITARICGICPVAYQMSAVHAVENAAGVTVDGPLRALRRLLYCGEWIESHTLHIYMLHAPDFLGYEDAISMAKDHGEVVKKGLELKKAGNRIVQELGGREIHPINVRVGGFYRVPAPREFDGLRENLERARDLAIDTVRWANTLPFPDFERAYEYVALRHEDEYPFCEGRIVSSEGIDVTSDGYDAQFMEYQEPHSTALHSMIRGRGAYFVGPMARFNLNRDKLTPIAAELAREIGLDGPCHNPFKSILIRAVEVLFACEEAIHIIDNYDEPDAPYIDVEPVSVTGTAATEAPRGLLYHRYVIGKDGAIEDAKIVPPTSQNQKTIEEDLRDGATAWAELPDDELQWRCEKTIRNYDPCISCSAHFLKMDVTRISTAGDEDTSS